MLHAQSKSPSSQSPLLKTVIETVCRTSVYVGVLGSAEHMLGPASRHRNRNDIIRCEALDAVVHASLP